jgi:hypothetical protein
MNTTEMTDAAIFDVTALASPNVTVFNDPKSDFGVKNRLTTRQITVVAMINAT